MRLATTISAKGDKKPSCPTHDIRDENGRRVAQNFWIRSKPSIVC
jgi:hypothetical protein